MNNNYFSHDSNSRNSDKLLSVRMKYGAEGYGIYFMLLERLREEANYMSIKDYNMLAFDLRVDASTVKSVVEDFGLFAFTENGECFYSESFNKRMAIKDEKKKKISEQNKKNAQKRWNKENNQDKDTNEIRPHNDGNAKHAKESKGKETKGNKRKDNNNSKDDVVDFTNSLDPILKNWKSTWKQQPNAKAIKKLQEAVDLTNVDLVNYAVDLAGFAQVDKASACNYIYSTVNNWVKQNVRTVSEAEEASRNFFKRNNRKGSSGRNSNVIETLPDWAIHPNDPNDDKTISKEQSKRVHEKLASLGSKGI